MSNALGIAAVTGVLESRLTALLNARGVTGFVVSGDHPASDPGPGIYIKLARIVPNAALRNLDVPTRRGDGTVVQRPQLALTLHYLLTFVGAAGNYEAERLAGLALTDLHAAPALTPVAIGEYLAGLADDHVLKDTDLADQLDRVRFTLLPLDDERLSKAWGLYNQSFYGLTVAYEAGPVLLEAPIEARAALPVASAGVFVVPVGIPRITKVRSAALDQPVLTLGQELILEGTNLRGPTTWLRIGALTLRVADQQIGVDRIVFPLTAALGLPAGVTSVEIVHQIDVSADPAVTNLRPGATSNAAPFALLPVVSPGTPAVTATTSGHDVRLRVTPAPDSAEAASLLLDRVGGGGHASSAAWRNDGADVVFSVVGLTTGTWLARVRVGGATSGLQSGGSGAYAQPAVTVP